MSDNLNYEKMQLQHEIKWLENKMIMVNEKIKKKPSKIKELNDLKRQVYQKQQRILDLSTINL